MESWSIIHFRVTLTPSHNLHDRQFFLYVGDRLKKIMLVKVKLLHGCWWRTCSSFRRSSCFCCRTINNYKKRNNILLGILFHFNWNNPRECFFSYSKGNVFPAAYNKNIKNNPLLREIIHFLWKDNTRLGKTIHFKERIFWSHLFFFNERSDSFFKNKRIVSLKTAQTCYLHMGFFPP